MFGLIDCNKVVLTPPSQLSIFFESVDHVHYIPSRKSRSDKRTGFVLGVNARVCYVLNFGPDLSEGGIGGVSSNRGPQIGPDSLFLILITGKRECTTGSSVVKSVNVS